MASLHPRQIIRVYAQRFLDRLGGFINEGFQTLAGRQIDYTSSIH